MIYGSPGERNRFRGSIKEKKSWTLPLQRGAAMIAEKGQEKNEKEDLRFCAGGVT